MNAVAGTAGCPRMPFCLVKASFSAVLCRLLSVDAVALAAPWLPQYAFCHVVLLKRRTPTRNSQPPAQHRGITNQDGHQDQLFVHEYSSRPSPVAASNPPAIAKRR